MRTAAVPTYALYGDQEPVFPDILHCETIPERCRLHDWRIRPHRHVGILQFFLLTGGRAEASIEGTELQILAPAALSVPPLTVHGFLFERGTQGLVLTLPAAEIAPILAGSPNLAARLERPIHERPDWQDLASLVHLFEAALTEDRAFREGRADALRALGGLVALHVARLARAPVPGSAPDMARDLVRRFRDLVEARLREQPGLDAYATRLGVSAAHLSRVCRAVTGRSALALVHDRLVLEAQRDLVYTSLTAAEIAERLGFADPAYFTRFFKSRTGLTPSGFRRERLLSG